MGRADGSVESKVRQKKNKKAKAKALLEAKTSQETSKEIPLIQKLTSDEIDDRVWAAAAISNLCEQESSRVKLLGANVVGYLIASLGAGGLEAQLELLGALRNLCVYGGEAVVMELYRKDALNPLLKAFTEFSECWLNPNVESSELKSKTGVQVLEQILTLVWTLSEASEAALQRVNGQTSLYPFIMSLLSSRENTSLCLAAGHCLNVLSEENWTCLKYFVHNPQLLDHLSFQADVSGMNENDAISYKVLCASILYNLCSQVNGMSKTKKSQVGGQIEEWRPAFLKSILSSIQLGLSLNIDDMVQHVINTATKEEPIKKEMVAGESALDKQLSHFDAQVGTLRMVLELAANVFSDDLPQEEEEEEVVAGEENMEEENMEEEGEDIDFDDMQAVTNLENDQQETVVDPSQRTLFHDIFPKILSLSQYLANMSALPDSLPSFVSHHIMEALHIIYCRSLGCLGNMLECVDRNWLLSNMEEMAYPLWTWLFNMALQWGTDGDKKELLDMALIAMCTLLRKLESLGLDYLPPLSDSQLQALVQSASNTSTPEHIRVRCISLLSIFGKRLNQIPSNQIIGTTLVTLLQAESTGLDVMSEALNAVYDIYADEAFDYDEPVFVGLGFLKILKSVLLMCRAKVKSVDKRKYRASRDRADEALLNLRLFIQYKEKEQRKNR